MKHNSRRIFTPEEIINNPYIFTKTDLEELQEFGLQFNSTDDIKFAMNLRVSNRQEFMRRMHNYIQNLCE